MNHLDGEDVGVFASVFDDAGDEFLSLLVVQGAGDVVPGGDGGVYGVVCRRGEVDPSVLVGEAEHGAAAGAGDLQLFGGDLEDRLDARGVLGAGDEEHVAVDGEGDGVAGNLELADEPGEAQAGGVLVVLPGGDPGAGEDLPPVFLAFVPEVADGGVPGLLVGNLVFFLRVVLQGEDHHGGVVETEHLIHARPQEDDLLIGFDGLAGVELGTQGELVEGDLMLDGGEDELAVLGPVLGHFAAVDDLRIDESGEVGPASAEAEMCEFVVEIVEEVFAVRFGFDAEGFGVVEGDFYAGVCQGLEKSFSEALTGWEKDVEHGV